MYMYLNVGKGEIFPHPPKLYHPDPPPSPAGIKTLVDNVQAHSSALPELPVEFWTPKGVWTAIPEGPFIHADPQSPPTLLGN